MGEGRAWSIFILQSLSSSAPPHPPSSPFPSSWPTFRCFFSQFPLGPSRRSDQRRRRRSEGGRTRESGSPSGGNGWAFRPDERLFPPRAGSWRFRKTNRGTESDQQMQPKLVGGRRLRGGRVHAFHVPPGGPMAPVQALSILAHPSFASSFQCPRRMEVSPAKVINSLVLPGGRGFLPPSFFLFHLSRFLRLQALILAPLRSSILPHPP